MTHKRPVNAELGAGQLRGRVKPLHTPLPAWKGIVERNTGQKMCQKRVCYLAGALAIPQSSSQRLCALGRQSYATGDTKRFLIQLIIRKEKGSPSGKTLLPSPIMTIKRQAVTPSGGSLFSLLFLL